MLLLSILNISNIGGATMNPLIYILITGIVSILASSGFWAFLQYQYSNKDTVHKALVTQQKAMIDVLIGLGHDKIMHLGGKYCDRGYTTHSEYENLYTYIYLPYKALGGNGSADRMMEQVNKLEMRENVHFEKENRQHVHKTSK